MTDRSRRLRTDAARPPADGGFGDDPPTLRWAAVTQAPAEQPDRHRWKPRRRAIGLAWHLMIPIAAMALPLIAMSVGVLWSQYKSERARAEAQLVDYAGSLGRLVDREFARSMAVGEMLARSTAFPRGDLNSFETEMQAAADLLSADLPNGAGRALITLRDAEGQLVFGTEPVTNNRASPTSYLRRAIASGHPEISDLFMSRTFGQPRLAVAVPVRMGASGPANPVGAIGVGVPRERFIAIVEEAALPDGGIASIQDRTGATVARSFRDGETLGKLPTKPVLDAIMHADSGLMPHGTRTIENVPSTIAFARAPVSGYVVEIDVAETIFAAPLRAFLLRAATIDVILTAGGLALAWFATQRVVAAFRRVPAAAEAGAAADGPPPMSLGLREADDLAARLAGAQAERDKEAASARGLFDSSPIGIALVGADGLVHAANDAFLGLIGRRRAALAHDLLHWQSLVPQENRERNEMAMASTLAGSPPPPFVQDICRPNGSRVPVLASFGKTSRGAGSVAIFMVDQREQRAAEAALRGVVAQQRLFIDKAPAGIAMFDHEMRFLAASRRYVQDFRLAASDPRLLAGRSHYEILPDMPRSGGRSTAGSWPARPCSRKKTASPAPTAR